MDHGSWVEFSGTWDLVVKGLRTHWYCGEWAERYCKGHTPLVVGKNVILLSRRDDNLLLRFTSKGSIGWLHQRLELIRLREQVFYDLPR